MKQEHHANQGYHSLQEINS